MIFSIAGRNGAQEVARQDGIACSWRSATKGQMRRCRAWKGNVSLALLAPKKGVASPGLQANRIQRPAAAVVAAIKRAMDFCRAQHAGQVGARIHEIETHLEASGEFRSLKESGNAKKRSNQIETEDASRSPEALQDHRQRQKSSAAIPGKRHLMGTKAPAACASSRS